MMHRLLNTVDSSRYKHAQESAEDATVWKTCVRSESEKDKIIKSRHEGVGGK